MIICLDTNVLISGVIWKGHPGQILDSWIDGHFEIIASAPIIKEYEINLEELGVKFGVSNLSYWLSLIREKIHVIDFPPFKEKWCRDADDDKFIACALACNADFLVTGDKDLLVLNGRFSFPIIKPRMFLGKIQ